MHDHLLTDIGKSILGAAMLGLPAYLMRVPLLLAYLAAGVILGPHLGTGWVKSAGSISALSEIGLVLLMFILGLEIDVRKLLQAGKAVLVNGITQFVGCALLAVAFFSLFDFKELAGSYSLVYLAVACSLSSTLVVVKILSDRMELDTLTSRITLGVLVIQDLWAIGFLALQPNLAQLSGVALAFSLSKALVLVVTSLLMAKYLLPRIFHRAGKHPELMLIVALAWCFAVCGIADALKLSLEMGALVAGVTIASFPYHADVAAKVSSLRDFFITLFFVGLGLQIPSPTWEIIGLASAVVVFVMVSRLLTVFPVLYWLRYGNRASLLPAINLSQLSEFALVLAALGVSYGHIRQELLSAFVLAMVFSALVSSMLIPSGHEIYLRVTPWLKKIGIKDHLGGSEQAARVEGDHPSIVMLGFFREASSLLQVMLSRYSEAALKKLMVVDFNPEAHQKLKALGLHCKYGDVGHVDTLRHLEIEKASILICTIPDHVLKGTSNLKLLIQLKRLAPKAKIIVTAETFASAREMYREGADYVFVPRLVSANYLADVLEGLQTDRADGIRSRSVSFMEKWDEILA